MEALLQHQQTCDDLHTLALEENRFMQQHRRTPDAAFLDRKRSLLTRLDETLAALRAAPKAEGPQWRQALDRVRARILQILQLERENEQLLLRFSLAGQRVPEPAQALPAGMLQKIYQRHS